MLTGITGPDEFHPNVNNNAFTLCAISLAIHWARYFSCLCQRNERDDVPDEYIQKALYLNLPYDNIKRLHYAHEGYDTGMLLTYLRQDVIVANCLAAYAEWMANRAVPSNSSNASTQLQIGVE